MNTVCGSVREDARNACRDALWVPYPRKDTTRYLVQSTNTRPANGILLSTMASKVPPAGSARQGFLANLESLLKKEMNREGSAMALKEALSGFMRRQIKGAVDHGLKQHDTYL